MLMKEVVEKYLLKLEKDNDTIKAYRLDLERFVEQFGEREIDSIIRDDIRDYLDQLTTRRGKRVSVATQNRHYATLSCLYGWAIREGFAKDHPMKTIPRRKPNKDLGEINTKDVIRYLDKKTIDEIFRRAPSNREEFLFNLLYTSGMRISEALALNTEDIRDGVIYIMQGKGNKPRVTYLAKDTEKLLKKYLEKRVPDRSVMAQAKSPEEREELKEKGALFTTNNGTRLGYHRANQLFKYAARGVKNPDGTELTLHQLRHTFCTERAGWMDSMVLQQIVGHSDIRTTLKYAKVANKVAEKQFHEFNEKVAPQITA